MDSKTTYKLETTLFELNNTVPSYRRHNSVSVSGRQNNSHPVDVNAEDSRGFTPLMNMASRGETAKITNLLTAPGILVNQTSLRFPEITALHLAARHGHTSIVKDLITAGATEVTAALIAAAKNRHVETVLALISAGADVNAEDSSGYTPLMSMALSGQTSMITNLLTAPGILVNQTSLRFPGITALHLAARHGHTSIVKDLITAGATEVTAALIAAAETGRTETVLALIGLGADINGADEYGRTALMGAAESGHTETVLTLTSAGADLNGENRLGTTALIGAAERGYTETVLALIRASADVNGANQYGRTALMAAAGRGYTETVSALINAGASLHLTTHLGGTALMQAAGNGHTETAFRLFNAIFSSQASATRPTPSFLSRLLLGQPAITPIETSYNQALSEFRQGLRNMFSTLNKGPGRHDLGAADVLMNIIAGYYIPSWCGNPNQEITRALTERKKPVILSSTLRAMNRFRSTLTSLTNAMTTPTLLRLTGEPTVEQGPSKKRRRD